MTTRDDGGQAFPCAGFDGPDGHEDGECGMTLRDWMAGMAMQGLLSGRKPNAAVAMIPGYAALAYESADAMLVERTK